MKPKMSAINRLFAHAHSVGALGTHIADTAIFATRRAPKRNAGDAAPRRDPVGAVGIHSVYDGPRKILGGAPILRRDKPA